MSISDRSRKILWARSGNRCAICRRELVAEATPEDPAAVIGDECHIVAQSSGGSRADSSATDVDSETNLLLLCKVDHKRVDDQPRYYTVERLRAVKLAHELWVQSSLASEPPRQLSVRSRRRDKSPILLQIVASGVELLALTDNVMAYDFSHDDIETEAEVELLSDFLQSLQEYGEIGDDLEQSGRVKASFELGKMATLLAEAGWIVYGGKIPQILEGGVNPPSNWVIATVRVKRLQNVLAEIDEAEKRTPKIEHDAQASLPALLLPKWPLVWRDVSSMKPLCSSTHFRRLENRDKFVGKP
jgi:hypothetical protein